MGSGQGAAEKEERIGWSPGHPRDGDSCWPGISSWQLLPQIERQLFEETVKTLNGFYVEAEKIGGSSYLEGCLACATAYFIFLCMETHYEKVPMPCGGHGKWGGWGGHQGRRVLSAPLALTGPEEDLQVHPGAE